MNDIVLIKDDEFVTRNRWPIGRVVETFFGKDNLVRSALIKTEESELKRPISKLVLLVPEDSPPMDQDPIVGS